MYHQTNLLTVTGATGIYVWWAQIMNPVIFTILAVLLALLVRQAYLQYKGEKTINK